MENADMEGKTGRQAEEPRKAGYFYHEYYCTCGLDSIHSMTLSIMATFIPFYALLIIVQSCFSSHPNHWDCG